MGPTNPTHWCIAKMSGFSTIISKGPQQRCRWAEAVDSHTVWGARHGDWLVHNFWESSTGWRFGTFLSPSTGKSNPNWRTPSFFRGEGIPRLKPPTSHNIPHYGKFQDAPVAAATERGCPWLYASGIRTGSIFWANNEVDAQTAQKTGFLLDSCDHGLDKKLGIQQSGTKTFKNCWVYLRDLHQSSKKRSSLPALACFEIFKPPGFVSEFPNALLTSVNSPRP